MTESIEKQFWDKVLEPGWQIRCPAFVKYKISAQYQLTIPMQEAEDIFQNAITRVLEKITIESCLKKDAEEVRKIIYGYLKYIIREWLRDEVTRKRRIIPKTPLMYEHLSNFKDIEINKHTLGYSYENAMRLYRIAWKELTATERDVFELYHLNENTQTDIANQLGKSLGTINNIIRTIQNKFYEIFERNQGGLL